MNIKLLLTLSVFLLPAVVFAQRSDLNNRFRLAQSYEQAGDIVKAASLYESLYREDPSSFQIFEALNRSYVQLKKYDESILIISQRLRLNPEDINLYGLLGSSYYQKGDETQAYKTWDDAVRKFSASPMIYRVIANYAIERRAFERAILYLSEGKKRSDEYFSFSFDLANLHTMLMHYAEATDEYCYILNKQVSHLGLIQSRMSSFITKPEAKEAAIRTINGWFDKTQDVNLLMLSGWVYMENKEYGKAFELYITIDKMRNNEGADLFNFAQSALQDGYFEEASKGFNKISEEYPNSPFAPNAKIGYAKTLEVSLDKKLMGASGSWRPYYKPQKQSEYEEVLRAYENILQLKNIGALADEVYFRMAGIRYYKLSDTEGAIADLNRLFEKSPASLYTVPAYSLLAKIYLVKNDLNTSVEYCNKIEEHPRAQQPDKLNSAYQRARIEFFQGNFAEALSVLQDISFKPEDNSANDAIELSLIINTSRQDSMSLLTFARAELLAEQFEFAKAAEMYKGLSQNNSLLTLRDLAEFRYAQMLIARDDLPGGMEILKGIYSREDAGIYADRALLLLGQVCQYGIKDNAKAIEYYETLLARFPSSLFLDEAREKILAIKTSPAP